MDTDSQMLAFPVRFANGKAAVVERDSYDEIAQGVEITCRTTRGERIEQGREDFGLPSIVFGGEAPAVSAQQVQAAIIAADLRATVLVEADTSALDAMMLRIGVAVQEGTNG